MSRSSRRLLTICTLFVLGVWAPPAVAVVHATDPLSSTLPGSFAGISVETNVVTDWFHTGCKSPVRAALLMLGRPEIRVGGNSQDRLWPTAPLPPGQNQVAGASYFHSLHCLSAMRLPIVLGLNLLGNNSAATGDLLAAVKNVVDPKLLTIALGNEPNLFGGRLPPPGGYPGFLSLYNQILGDLRTRFGSALPPTLGPDPAARRWTAETAQFVSDESPGQVSEHLYGLNGCGQVAGTPTYPTVQQLFTPDASSSLITGLAPVVAAAQAAGIPAQISEANSVACSGIHGVSDSPEAGLWAMTLLGSAAQAGFSRVEFHDSRGFYDPFVIVGGHLVFRPEWISMILANKLWPSGTRPMHLQGVKQTGIGAWIGQRPDGSLAAMIVNYDRRHPHDLVLRTTRRHATVGRLEGLGQFALTLDGRQLLWAHGEPSWTGTSTVEHPRISHDTVHVTLAPRSGAWLTLS